ncbi:MAG: flagellar hook-basal body complex protein [Holosporales bacterium]|jgi:flagellar hook protein FlgE|nr:flagellar hook-basal body complex protein [Holosporales bacterium]
MSLFESFEILILGLKAQDCKIKTVANNVSNAKTPGYKAHQIQFSTLGAGRSERHEHAGGVIARRRSNVEQQGDILLTDRPGDLAIDGKGFFLVRNAADTSRRLGCTRTGAFDMDKSGTLTDESGYRLQGQKLITGEVIPAPTLDALEDIRSETEAVATNTLRFNATLGRNTAMGGNGLTWDATTSANTATNDELKYVAKIYDPSGQEHEITFICGRIDPDISDGNDWGLSIAPSGDYTFLFKNQEGDPLTFRDGTVAPFKFDPDDDKIDREYPAKSLEIMWDGGGTSHLNLSIGDVHLEDTFKELRIDLNGHMERDLIGWDLINDGFVEFSYSDSTTEKAYRVPLATCASPNALIETSDGVYFSNEASGDWQIHIPEDRGLGTIFSGAQEASTVNIATELSEAVVAQHIYAANGKVMSTINNMLEVLERL